MIFGVGRPGWLSGWSVRLSISVVVNSSPTLGLKVTLKNNETSTKFFCIFFGKTQPLTSAPVALWAGLGLHLERTDGALPSGAGRQTVWGQMLAE